MNIINNINDSNVPAWGNQKKYIAVHYLGVVGQNNKIEQGGYGAHFYIYWDGRVFQACSYDAVVWQVGTGGYYKQLHPYARNNNTIGIEMCVKCDGNSSNPKDPTWYFTEETQQACVELVQYLMKKFNIPIENVLRHGDITNKWCPAPYLNNNKYKTSWTWNEFKARVAGTQKTNQWIFDKNQSKWWYKHSDGTCTKNNWEKIDGSWYHFDASGWMQTGWLKIGNDWFYLDSNGAMCVGWKWVNGWNKWFYFNQNGIMQTGWIHLDKWYYLDSNGAMVTGWKEINKKTYYFNEKGEMVTNTYVQSADPNLKNKYYWVNGEGVWNPSDDSWDITKYNHIKLQ